MTNDRLAGGIAAGGSALYAAIAARELGAAVRVVTSHGADFVGRLDGIDVEVTPAEHTTTFENVYVEGRRRGRVLARAADLPVVAGASFVCPVVDEVAPVPGAAVGLQGWLRRFDADGYVLPKPLGDVSRFEGCTAAFVSAEEIAEGEVAGLREVVPVVVVTHGPAGAECFVGRERHWIAACPATEVDPTGAGDVFATAFLIALARGESHVGAGAWGACAASLVVEGVGPSALSRLATELPGRLDWYNRVRRT